jgi:hypothetical protein
MGCTGGLNHLFFAMRKPGTIRKEINKYEQKMHERTKNRRVSAGALNRDVANISHKIMLLKRELNESEKT